MKIFDTPYTRPVRFSNQNNHFPNEELNKILEKADYEMKWSDYYRIFHLTPVGTYKECCYFLPFALCYIEKTPDCALDCITNIVWFVSENVDNLDRDQLLEKCCEAIKSCLETWTKEFRVIHYNHEACKAKGWTLNHHDIVDNSQLVIETLDELVYYKSLAKLAIDFTMELRTSEQPLQAAWYLALCSDLVIYNFIRDKPFREMIFQTEFIDKCQEIVLNSMVDIEYSPTFWNDVFDRLNSIDPKQDRTID